MKASLNNAIFLTSIVYSTKYTFDSPILLLHNVYCISVTILLLAIFFSLPLGYSHGANISNFVFKMHRALVGELRVMQWQVRVRLIFWKCQLHNYVCLFVECRHTNISFQLYLFVLKLQRWFDVHLRHLVQTSIPVEKKVHSQPTLHIRVGLYPHRSSSIYSNQHEHYLS